MGALVLTGPSSCGKGHVASALGEVLSIPSDRHLSMGEILRETVTRAKTEPEFAAQLSARCQIGAATNILESADASDDLLAKIRQHGDELASFFQRSDMHRFTSQLDWLEFCVTRGLLVPNRWTHALVEAKIDRVLETSDAPLILDGYPRTVQAAEHLIAYLTKRNVPVVKVFHLSISKQEMLSRAVNRGRRDDELKALLSRYEFYVEKVQPSVDYMKHVLPANTIALIDAHQAVYDELDGERVLNLSRSVANVVASALLNLGAPRGVVRDLLEHHMGAVPTNV
jgi:adenylate kinase family enzyme